MFGIFKQEAKHRFICDVEIDNSIQECYISSSSHLLPMLNLVDKKVLLKENKGKNLRTKYTVQALWEGNEKILLNLNYINDLVEKYLLKTHKDSIIKREHKLREYKSDFYIPDKNLVIEAKGLLSDNNIAFLPYNSGERCIRQLKEIKKLLKQNTKVEYFLVLLNSKIKEIQIDDRNKEYTKIFNSCISSGMKVRFYKLEWRNCDCSIKEARNINFKHYSKDVI